MNDQNVKSKQLVERFNKYAKYRKESKKSNPKAFSEKIKHTQKDEALPEKAKTHAPPQIAQAKPISDLQAKRLAKYAPLIQQSAAKHNVPVELICGVILQESNGKSRAVSKAGAQGLMQLMPATAKRFGVKDSFDPAQNIEGGTKYLSWLMKRFDSKVDLVLAGYNAGEGAVEKHGMQIPPYKETQDYVPKVLGYTQSMINILVASAEDSVQEPLPTHARRV